MQSFEHMQNLANFITFYVIQMIVSKVHLIKSLVALCQESSFKKFGYDIQ
jgi:hypothetical protein